MLGKTTRSWAQSPSWSSMIKKKMLQLETKNPGQIGLYIKDLSTGEIYSHRGDEIWYLASGIKIPVAIETLRQVSQKKISLDDTIVLSKNDLVDGGGFTNSKGLGSTLSLRFLFEQMIIHSDNTASDLLINKIGLDSVNNLIKETVTEGFFPITTLADVRRLTYSEAHPKAMQLDSTDLLSLKKASSEKKRWTRLKAILQVPEDELLCHSIDEAFTRYYGKHYNSAKLSAYTQLYEKLVQGELLDSEQTQYLLKIMSQVETGQKRLVSGFKDHFYFAHKTGTQHRRICDFGVLWDKTSAAKDGLLVATCIRDFKQMNKAEKLMAQVGSLIRTAYRPEPALAKK